MASYYNEHDRFAAAWLRELIREGLIADGDVDERDIQEVAAADVRGYTQCHFFAGIGGWSYALRLAGWPDDRPVWTGSCPCQPFSAAGKGDGAADSRHLWPAWFRFIRECRPGVVFGEQVSSADGLAWFDAVSTDLEGTDYAIWAVDSCAAGVDAPHIRQRLWWVAHVNRGRCEPGDARQRAVSEPHTRSATSLMDDACGDRRELGGLEEYDELESTRGLQLDGPSPRRPWDRADWIYFRDGKHRPVEPGTFPLAHGLPARVGRLRGYGNAIVPQVAAEFIHAYCEARGL